MYVTVKFPNGRKELPMESDLMTAESILAQKGGELFSVTLDATVYDAVTMMVENKVGSTLIKDDTRIVGIYTERDLMRNCIDPNFDMKSARMGDYMSKGLKFAPYP